MNKSKIIFDKHFQTGKVDLAWQVIEINEFGLNKFVACNTITVENGTFSGVLGKHNWNMIRLKNSSLPHIKSN